MPQIAAECAVAVQATKHNAKTLGIDEPAFREAAKGFICVLYLMRDAYDQMLSPMRMAAEMATHRL